jgi:20S proteasome subunit alpha 3
MEEEESVKTNTFNEEGRLPQVEFAIKNVSKAGTIIGCVCADGVVLLGVNKIEVGSQREKIYQITNTIYCAVSGLFGDAMRLKRFAQIKAQNVLEEYGVECPISVLCRSIGEEKQRFTQYGGSRPFGVSFLYAGVDKEGYVLYSTDPSGTMNQWRGVCFGEDEDGINNGLRNDLPRRPMGMEEGIVEVLKIYGKVRECSPKEADRMEVLYFSKDRKRYLTRDEISELLGRIESELSK